MPFLITAVLGGLSIESLNNVSLCCFRSSLDTPVISRVYTQRLKFAGILHIKASDKF